MAAEWEPAGDLERGLRDALLAGNQEEYFRLLTDVTLLLPVSAAAAAGTEQATWYTGTDDENVYVVAFTSPEAMFAGLGEAAEAFRQANLGQLAVDWPDNDWWLAINPGLPIESYLPYWYVVQVASGEYTVPEVVGEDLIDAGAVSTGTGDGLAEGSTPAEGDRVAGSDLKPANYAERLLLEAAVAGDRDGYLKTMLLVDVLVPVPGDASPDANPGDPGFRWLTGHLDGEPAITLFTSEERLREHFTGDAPAPRAVWSELVSVLRAWPDETWTLALNPDTDLGTRLTGEHVASLAAWAAEMGLGGGDRDDEEETAAAGGPDAGPGTAPPAHGTAMQKVIPANQVSFYLDRGYDRVAGFVHRAVDVVEFSTPEQLYAALGLAEPGSAFAPGDQEAYVIRWEARRADLYRRPFGGQTEEEMRAMDGWVLERPPFVGKGLAPSRNGAAIPEYKVDSVQLPHGTEMYQISADSDAQLVAVYDADTRRWWRASEQDTGEEV